MVLRATSCVTVSRINRVIATPTPRMAMGESVAHAVVPIASITKLMTAMVVLDGAPNLQAPISISDEDVDYLKGSRSRLGVGSAMTRETALLLALMIRQFERRI